MLNKTLRPIAIYLPQFHPIPENDDWWGKGFTEWTNVSKAKPLFKGHYQPHLPSELGFYDLRVPEVREQQAQLAREHGIYGFCYYHYWFNGKRVLERPFNEVLASGKPDFPFMLCWANENWTRVWDGGEKHILLEQNYSEEDDIAHIKSLIPAFKDSRYIKVDGKPVFAIYRSTRIPDVKATIKRWRNEAKKEGLELYLCRMESFGESGEHYLQDGFDAAIEFEPSSNRLFHSFTHQVRMKLLRNKLSTWYANYKLSDSETKKAILHDVRSILDYSDYVNFLKKYPKNPYKYFPGVTPMWDNSARRKNNYFIFKNSTPEKYREWLQHEIENFKPYSVEENFIFINAWNEWAEGNHLEPCRKWGRAYLEATRTAFWHR
ncbi:glycoside hydrolase family 99-like domain-containing protein [Pontibacter populi]|uniref:Glycoside hydrolase family 99-like domain-containing protein n=1 Tax=Pontibacter populi TaxID=890055 RepID=A0ABV1RW94_9BACT